MEALNVSVEVILMGSILLVGSFLIAVFYPTQLSTPPGTFRGYIIIFYPCLPVSLYYRRICVISFSHNLAFTSFAETLYRGYRHIEDVHVNF